MATFHQISSQNLECPICLTLINQPKLLTCSHTFCKDCLERAFQTQPAQQSITCPVCRKETPVPSGDVDKLQTNVPLSSLVDEVRIKSPTCSVCETDGKSPAVAYCQNCDKNMCKPCEIKHSSWTPFSNHAVVAMKEVVSGEVPPKERQRCKKHPSENKEYFCPGCREYVCFRCGLLEHSHEGHAMVEASIHEEMAMCIIKDLKEKATLKKTTVEQYIESIELQRKELKALIRKLNDDIDKTYEEHMHLLSKRKNALKCQVERWSGKFEKELGVMAEESRQTIIHIKTVVELVTNGMKVPLEKDALLAHDTLCDNLESILGRNDPDDELPRSVTMRAQRISFRKYAKVNELYLGELEGYPKWDLKADVGLPKRGSMMSMTAVPDGRMAVGSRLGGIHLYTTDGELTETVLKDVKTRSIGFLSDGRCVVLDEKGEMSLYTPQWEMLDVMFKTMKEFLPGRLTVDGGDNIYVGYMSRKKIQIFTAQGGKATKEIMCGEDSPRQLFSFQSTGNLLILTNTGKIMCLDSRGKEGKALLSGRGLSAYPAVCQNDSVIVAYVKDKRGLVSIHRRTREMGHVEDLITDFRIGTQAGAYSCYLQVFIKSGDIAFCTSDRLYIFHYSV